MSSPRLIKKYANRRLYDTSESRHVTLPDIRDLIVSGTDVSIIDDTSGADITRALLLQIIVEQEQAGDPLLPQVLLTQLIRFYGNPMQHMMGEYLQESVQTFTSQQSAFQKQMANVLSNAPVDAMQGLMRQNLAAWESMFTGSAPRQADDPDAPSGHADEDSQTHE